jgi:hypothetical protein
MDRVEKGFLAAIAVSAVVAIFVFFRWACHSDYKQAQVKQVMWEHFTDLRERTNRGDGDWDDWGNIPSSRGYYDEPIFNKKCRSKRRGTFCCGHDKDGHCTANCPKYDDWCDYNYWDWPVIDTLYIGELGEERTEYKTFGSKLDDNHRESTRALYSITFAQQGKDWVYKTKSAKRYKEFVVGDIWMIEMPRFGDRSPSKKSSLEQPGS